MIFSVRSKLLTSSGRFTVTRHTSANTLFTITVNSQGNDHRGIAHYIWM